MVNGYSYRYTRIRVALFALGREEFNKYMYILAVNLARDTRDS